MATKKDSILSTLNTLQDALDKVEGELNQNAWNAVNEKAAKIRASTEHTVVGLIGPSGAGKSTLINRMLGAELLHADSGGQSCSLSLVKVYNKEDDQYRVTVQYYNKEALARFLLPEEVNGEKDEREVNLATEVLTELWGSVSDIPPLEEVDDVMDLIPQELAKFVLDPAKRRDTQVFHSVEAAHEYLISIADEEGRAFLVQDITVTGRFPELEENVCLMDIPGSGDTLFLNNLMRKGLEQSDLVLFVEEQPRFANADVIRRLEKNIYMYERKLGFALCVSKSGEGFKQFQKLDEKKRAKMEGGTMEEEFVSSKIKLFEANAKKHFGAKLWEKLQDIHYFFLEKENDAGEEPLFSQQQRAELKEFIRSMASSAKVWDVIEMNVNALVEDIMSYEHKPLVESLDDQGVAAIKLIFQGEDAFVLRPAIEAPLSLDRYTHHTHFRRTLLQAGNTAYNLHPYIPIWDHVRSNAVNVQDLMREITRFRSSRETAFDAKMQSVSNHFTTKLGENKARFVTNRLRGALLERLDDCFKSSKDFLAEELTLALAREFGPRMPVYPSGPGAIERSKQALTQFIADNMKDMRVFVLDEYEASFFTLERAFNECVRDLDALNAELWRPVHDLTQLVAALKNASQANDSGTPDVPDGSLPNELDPLDELEEYIQTHYHGRLPSLQELRPKNVRTYKKRRVNFYLASSASSLETSGLTRIGFAEDLHHRTFKDTHAKISWEIVDRGCIETNYGAYFKRIMAWLFKDSKKMVGGSNSWFEEDRDVMRDVMIKVRDCIEALEA